MENYDEDLNENSFFQVLQSDHLEVFHRATVEGWIICVPRAGSVPKYVLTHEDFFGHILVPSDELPESHFRTLNDKEVRILNRAVTIEQEDITRPHIAHILFEETFYTDELKYKVLCIDSPLERRLIGGPDNSSVFSTINTLRDSIDLLWTVCGDHNILEKIDVIYGPMFSGKTTELIRRLKRYQIANYNCVIVKYSNDIRYGEGVTTHDNQTLPAVTTEVLLQIDADGYDVIGIDEGQFFPDIVSFSENLANKGKIVIVAALDGTYQRLPFGNILNLVPLAESVIKLSAVCMKCFKDASYTKRITKESELEVIGGADKYMSVCRQCHFSMSTKRSSPCKYVDKENPIEGLPCSMPHTHIFKEIFHQ